MHEDAVVLLCDLFMFLKKKNFSITGRGIGGLPGDGIMAVEVYVQDDDGCQMELVASRDGVHLWLLDELESEIKQISPAEVPQKLRDFRASEGRSVKLRVVGEERRNMRLFMQWLEQLHSTPWTQEETIFFGAENPQSMEFVIQTTLCLE